MPLFRKFSWIVVVILSMALMPWEGLHGITEAHDSEIHHCDFDFCLSETEHDCDLCAIHQPVRESLIVHLPTSQLAASEIKYGLQQCEFIHFHLQQPRNKAPPRA